MIQPRKWPQELWADPTGQLRPICRCSNIENCLMAKREIAYTFLDVKYPQLVCKGCGNEFELLEADCTHPYVSFSPPIGESSKGKGKTKGTSKGAANGNGTKGKGKGAYEYNGGEYKGKGKGKGRGESGDIDIIAILKQ